MIHPVILFFNRTCSRVISQWRGLSDPFNPWPKGQALKTWPFGHGLNEVSLLVNPFLPLALSAINAGLHVTDSAYFSHAVDKSGFGVKLRVMRRSPALTAFPWI